MFSFCVLFQPILAQDSLLGDVALPSSLLPMSRTHMNGGHSSAPPLGGCKALVKFTVYYIFQILVKEADMTTHVIPLHHVSFII